MKLKIIVKVQSICQGLNRLAFFSKMRCCLKFINTFLTAIGAIMMHVVCEENLDFNFIYKMNKTL